MTQEYGINSRTQFDILCLYARRPALVRDYVQPGFFSAHIYLDIARSIAKP
jgi:hypothetical protein